jgi:hypothetical protein
MGGKINMARNRIIYASQSVWANGEVLYRVQSLGTTTTFTNEDIFELGHLDVIDVVDDVPAVAVTLNTNDFGDVRTLAILAQVPAAKRDMDATASGTNANLVAGTNATSGYVHGVAMADFAVTCGNLTGITMWAPVQAECDLGTLANNIDQTLFLDEVYVNSLEFSYTTGANATENYGAETDNKMWLLNDGAYVSMEVPTVTAAMTDFTIASGIAIPVLSTGNYAFLRKDSDGAPAITVYDASENEAVNWPIKEASDLLAGELATHFSFTDPGAPAAIGASVTGPITVTVPTNLTLATDDRIEVVYAGNMYNLAAGNQYFEELDSADTDRAYEVGALRQGQVEVYIVDPDSVGSTYTNAWRLTGATISADLTREPLTELGHLGPYDRPITLPIPLTVTVDSTAGDLENWARFAGQKSEYDGDTLDDIDLNDLMGKDNLILVVKVFEQTDEEAGGTGASRKALTIAGKEYQADGVVGTYAAATDQEYALKTVVVKNLKITDEGMTLDVGANATQTFGFRSNNDLFVVKGDLTNPSDLADLGRNSS